MRVPDPRALVFAALLSACDTGGGGNPPPPPPGPGNSAPSFTSAATASVAEGTAGAFYTATASDPDGDAVTFSIGGGVDAARFSITGGGALSFVAPPDFETPQDQGADNAYDVVLSASDGRGGTATLALRVTVTDVADSFAVRRRGAGFSSPLFLTGTRDGTGRVFIVEKGGLIRILNPATGAVNATPFLDLATQVSTNSERGLLGLALAPDYATSRAFYVYITNLAGDSELRRYLRSAANGDVADAASGDVILTFTQPAANHNGGWIGFGPDGFLYVASGDGGGNATVSNPAQNTSSLLGKMLRIDVAGDDFPADPARDYRIPAGNPFAGGGGAPEVYAYGLRNPYRASFDPATGRLLIGDVGELLREEIDVIVPGAPGLNFGWIRFEGTLVFLAAATAPNAVFPVVEYAHGSGPFEGNSVIGGVVNRGPVPALFGHYIFGDFISGNIWSLPASAITPGTTLTSSALTRQTTAFVPNIGAIGNISSFGADDAGNVYVVDYDGEIFRMENP